MSELLDPYKKAKWLAFSPRLKNQKPTCVDLRFSHAPNLGGCSNGYIKIKLYTKTESPERSGDLSGEYQTTTPEASSLTEDTP